MHIFSEMLSFLIKLFGIFVPESFLLLIWLMLPPAETLCTPFLPCNSLIQNNLENLTSGFCSSVLTSLLFVFRFLER